MIPEIDVRDLRFVPGDGGVWVQLLIVEGDRELFLFADATPALSELLREHKERIAVIGRR